jgi:hypothetical protein
MRKGEQRRTMGKESEILTSSPFKNQLHASLKEKQPKTGNLTVGLTRTEQTVNTK